MAVRLFLRALLSSPLLPVAATLALIALLIRMAIDDRGMAFNLVILSPIWAPMFTMGMVTTRGVLSFGAALPNHARRAMLSRSLCPGCAYALELSRVDTDGCVVCSECASAWDVLTTGAGAYSSPEVHTIGPWAHESRSNVS